MKKYFAVLLVVSISVLILAACATPPAEEMNKAQDAVTRAENDPDALSYAPNTLVRAREALTRMQNEANAKRYDAAKNFAAEAIALAEKAIIDGRTGAARAREEAANLISSLSRPLEETTNALRSAQQTENVKTDLDAVSDDLDSTRDAYNEARQDLSNDNYPDAASRAQEVRSQIANINSQLNEAMQSASRKQ